jgi:hypothetical protein
MELGTLQHGDIHLRAYRVDGVVEKAEHWSETHVSGHIEAPHVYTGMHGDVRSSGGGGWVSSKVKNWTRLYVDTDQGEAVVIAPGEFAAREGHRLGLRYIESGAKGWLVKATNENTGAYFTTVFDGRQVVGSSFRGLLFKLLTIAVALFSFANAVYWTDGVLSALTLLLNPAALGYTYQWLLPPLLVWGLGRMMTRKHREREAAVRSFIAQVQET